ncbi:MAG: transcriptional regulator [Jatrophihabitantaceae bacterium]
MLVSLPTVVAALPASASKVTAATLLARIQQSQRVGYSGYAESLGGLSLPVTNQFSALSNLFGDRTQLRVWWRSARDWRVDSIGFSGETDLHGGDLGFWRWDYESNQATFTEQPTAPEIRLPTDLDLLPPQLADRLLSQATPAEASRLPAARVAGISAPGIRIRPDEPASTVDHVDVWADAATGLPLRVKVVGKQAGTTALTASFLDVHLATPPASSTAFAVPQGANLHSSADPDLATAINQLGGGTPPTRLAGIARNGQLPGLGSVGVYGQGVTEFVAAPLPRRIAFSLRRQLAPAAAAADAANNKPTSASPSDIVLNAGPLNLLLTSFNDPGGPWLLVGTVTADTLAKAATDLRAAGSR